MTENTYLLARLESFKKDSLNDKPSCFGAFEHESVICQLYCYGNENKRVPVTISQERNECYPISCQHETKRISDLPMIIQARDNNLSLAI